MTTTVATAASMSMDVAGLGTDQKKQVAKVLQGLAQNFSGWVHCQIAAMQLDPAEFDAEPAEPAANAKGQAQQGKKRKKDPNREKRAPSPYNVYVKIASEEWAKAHPDGEKPPGGIMAYASQQWSSSFMNQKSSEFDKERLAEVMSERAGGAPSTPALSAAPTLPVEAAADEDEAAPVFKKKKKKKTQDEDADEDENAAKERKRLRKEKKKAEKARKAAEAEAAAAAIEDDSD